MGKAEAAAAVRSARARPAAGSGERARAVSVGRLKADPQERRAGRAQRFSLTKQRRRNWCGIFLDNGTGLQEEDRSRGPWEVGSPQGGTRNPEDRQCLEAVAHGLPLPSLSPWQLGSARCDFSCRVPGNCRAGVTCRAAGDRGGPLLGCQEPASTWSPCQEVLSDVAGEFQPNRRRTSCGFQWHRQAPGATCPPPCGSSQLCLPQS